MMPAAARGFVGLWPALILPACLWSIAAAADVPRHVTAVLGAPQEAPFVTKLIAPGAVCMAVSDVADALAVGFKWGGRAEVWLHKLDAAGAIVKGDPVKIPLPKPGALGASAVCTAALTFHPKLPLLYVWQDVNPGDIGKPQENPVFKEFDHLLVVNLASGTPMVAATLGRGPEYAYARGDGEIVLSAEASRLYLPNLRMPTPAPNSPATAVGYMEIDAAGMPIMTEGRPKLVLEDVSPVLGLSNSYGMVPVSDDIWIFPGTYGLMTLDRTNRRGRITGLTYPGNPYSWFHSGHPTLPVVYSTCHAQGIAYRIEHVGGFLSNIQQSVNLGVGVITPPLLMAKRKTIAWGSGNCVVLLGIDDAGCFTKDASRVPVNNPPGVAGLAYSEKFDRLYVSAEGE